MSLGDFDLSTVIDFKFTTFRPSTGAPHQLAGTPAISVYKDNGTTQTTTGVTLTVDFDSVTGLNHVRIDTSADGAFYSSGSFFDVVITVGTVDSVSAVGAVVGRFTIRKTADLKPTTAGRTLDVSSGGEAGVDWANVGSPTTSLNLSGTTISTSQAVASVSGNVGGNVVGSTGSISGVTFPSNFASLGINASGHVSRVVLVDTTTTNTDMLTVAGIADGVWDEVLSGHLTAGSTGNALNAAGSAGDPWSTTLPGSYTGSQAGKMLSDILVDTGTTLQAELDGIQADTEDIQLRLPSALVGGRIDATVDGTGMEAGATAAIADAVWDELLGGHVVAGSAAVILGDGAADAAEANTNAQTVRDDWVNGGRLDLLLDAVKAKTDTLPTFPANFASFSINASGFVTVVTNNDKTGYSLATTPPTAAAIADAVWDEIIAGHSITGSTGAALAAAGGSGDPWSTALPGAYAAGTAGYIIGTNLDEPVSSGGGGGGSVVVPVGGVVQTTVDGTTIKISTGTSAVTVTIATVDEDGTAVDCSALTLQVVIESLDKTDITTIANGSITKTSTTVAFAIPSSCRAAEKTYRWSLRNTANDLAIMGGSLFVTYAAGAD